MYGVGCMVHVAWCMVAVIRPGAHESYPSIQFNIQRYEDRKRNVVDYFDGDGDGGMDPVSLATDPNS